MNSLKLIAFDAEDLGVISAHLQDAIVRIEDIAWLARDHRLALVMRRFDWAQALDNGGRELLRRQTALRFERVRGVRSTGIDLPDGRGSRPTETAPLVLLTIAFTRAHEDDPAGTITLTFAGAAAIELEVECVEVELRDLGPAWTVQSQPRHPTGQGGKPDETT